MTINKFFSPNHDDIVHDISYNFYGTRIATCSSDQRIKVFDFNDRAQDWVLNDEWKAHDSSVLKVKWAHPEFGSVIASSSLDRSVRIWEEQCHGIENNNTKTLEPKESGKRWIEKARLVDSRGSIQDIDFSPVHLGLKLSTSSTDGIIRIYEAMDVMNISHWTLMDEFEVYPTERDVDGQFCVCWCPSRFLDPMLVVGCGKEFTAKVLDVSWAPNLGRSYELIATACKDRSVRVFKFFNEASKKQSVPILSNSSVKSSSMIDLPSQGKSFKVKLMASLSDHDAEVWRVSWNVTGTILASGGDDGKMRLWKSDHNEEWKCVGVLPDTVS